jgi:hypothetical protein
MAFTVALVVVASAYAFASLRSRVRPWSDFAFVYAAGRSWLKGFSPYDFDRWNAEWAAVRPPETVVSQPMPFMYFPHWAPLAVFFGALPWPVASRLWDACNVLAHFGTCALCLKLSPGSLREKLRRPGIVLLIAIATFNPAVRYAVWQSQMSLLPTLGVVGAFWAWQEKKTLWLAVFAFIASLKPQISFLPVLFLLLNGGHAGLLWGAAAAIAIGTSAMLPSGLERLPSDVAHCYGLHMNLTFNQPSEYFSVPALGANALSGNGFMLTSLVFGTGAVAALTYARRVGVGFLSQTVHQTEWLLSMVVAITAASMPIHGYDLVLYTPLVLAAYPLRHSWPAWVVLPLILSAGRPHFVARFLPFGQHPAPVLTGAVLVLLLLALRAKAKDSPDLWVQRAKLG